MLSEWILGGTAIPLRGMDPKVEILVLWKFSSKFQLMFRLVFYFLVFFVCELSSQICFLQFWNTVFYFHLEFDLVYVMYKYFVVFIICSVFIYLTQLTNTCSYINIRASKNLQFQIMILMGFCLPIPIYLRRRFCVTNTLSTR